MFLLVHEDWHLITWFRPWSSTTYHHVECKQNPMNSWGDVLRKTPTGAHACLELIEGNRMQWLQRFFYAWPCCRCWGHFVSQGNNRTQIKTQNSSWGRNYHKWSKNVQDFHHRCQWNSRMPDTFGHISKFSSGWYPLGQFQCCNMLQVSPKIKFANQSNLLFLP